VAKDRASAGEFNWEQ
jgi:hypothetical protein